MDDLNGLIEKWPVNRVAVAVTGPTETMAVGGDASWTARTASISKLFAAYAGLVAVEEESITLEDPVGPPGSTARHLLAHASGLAFDDDRVLSPPETRRIYSNTGIERFAAHLANAADMSFTTYLQWSVFEPLGLAATSLVGSPAHGIHSSAEDLARFARELMSPTLIQPETLGAATEVHFPELKGALPGIGSYDPNPWGLGFEIKGAKKPHWTGTLNDEKTFGHFGGSGSFLWVDPTRSLATVAVSDRDFGEWSLDLWPEFSDAVIGRYG